MSAGQGPSHREDASAAEPAPTSTADRVAALRVALRHATRTGTRVAAPVFSPDGGVTVRGPGDRRARLQPLGQRTRISLSEGDDLIGEAEVDSDALVVAIGERGDAFEAAAAALAVENGLWL